MIVKYLSKDVWGYIDNVRQAAAKSIDCDELIEQYNDERDSLPHCPDYQDPAEYMNGEKLPADISASNKAFLMAGIGLADEGINRHSENLLEPELMNNTAVAILVYLEDCKEYDAVLLVTNQRAFLMNDKGQTIDRLN